MAKSEVNLGYSKRIVFEELSKMYFEVKRKNPSEEEFEELIQEIADDALSAAIPNEILGLNPHSRMSLNIRKSTMPEFFAVDNYFEKVAYPGDKIKANQAKKEIGKAVTQLTDSILEHVYKFQIKQKSGADLTDFKQVSDFQAVQKKGNTKYSEEEIDYMNQVSMVNNIIRHMIGIYFYSSIMPWMSLSKNDIYQIFDKGGVMKISLKDLYKKNVLTNILHFPAKLFTKMFMSLKVKDLFKDNWVEKVSK